MIEGAEGAMCFPAQASKLWKSRGWEFFIWCSSLLCHPRKVSLRAQPHSCSCILAHQLCGPARLGGSWLYRCKVKFRCALSWRDTKNILLRALQGGLNLQRLHSWDPQTWYGTLWQVDNARQRSWRCAARGGRRTALP